MKHIRCRISLSAVQFTKLEGFVASIRYRRQVIDNLAAYNHSDVAVIRDTTTLYNMPIFSAIVWHIPKKDLTGICARILARILDFSDSNTLV